MPGETPFWNGPHVTTLELAEEYDRDRSRVQRILSLARLSRADLVREAGAGRRPTLWNPTPSREVLDKKLRGSA